MYSLRDDRNYTRIRSGGNKNRNSVNYFPLPLHVSVAVWRGHP